MNSTIINTLRILARDIESEDGVANAALHQAAERLVELVEENKLLQAKIAKMEAEKNDWLENGNVEVADAWLANLRWAAEQEKTSVGAHRGEASEVLLPLQCQGFDAGQSGKEM